MMNGNGTQTEYWGESSGSTSHSSQQDVEDDRMIALVLSEEYAKLDGAVGWRLTNLEPVPLYKKDGVEDDLGSNLWQDNQVPPQDPGPYPQALIIETYTPPDPGPYPQDQPKQNSVRFTPTQCEMFLSSRLKQSSLAFSLV
ncbi:hypothetical protein glysoja_001318 [Glycine soja]|nr:hypothetical protein glysoja_001318 [Glycine soja]